jgi:sugar lactone lactonase YvrE
VHTSTIYHDISSKIRQRIAGSSTATCGKRLRQAAIMLPLMLLAVLSNWPLSAQVPAVLATSQIVLNSGFSSGPTVTDACGDIYVFESGGTSGIVEIQANTGNVTTIIANSQGYVPLGGRPAFYMDQAKANLYFPDFTNFYTAHFDQLPIVNCVPGAINDTFAGNTGSLPSPNYYYGTANDITGDAAGNIFFTTTQSAQTSIFEEANNAGIYTPSLALASWPNQINYIASDAAGDIYFADQTSTYTVASGTYVVSNNIYLLKAGYSSAPTLFASGFNDVTGLSFDAAGNLYVTDSGGTQTPTTSAVYEIPNESTGLNPANQFAVAGAGASFKVAVDANHNIFLSGSSGATEVKTGSAVAPETPFKPGSSSTFPITYIFNAAVTPASFTAVTGTAASTTFATGTGGCTVGTTYQPTAPATALANSTCTLSATYTPSAVGVQTGAILLTSPSGTVSTFVSGTGQAPAVTIDPGTLTTLGSGFNTPEAITVDSAGNTYVVDAGSNTISEFASGSTTGTTIATGTLTLSTPSGIAIDASGDIYIADTGNNRIVEIPVVNGVLTSSSSVALNTGLSAPKGLAFDAAGNLYVADTGNKRLVFIANYNGSLNFTSSQSVTTGFSAPSAVTVDPNGNVYVADATNNDVVKFPAPFTGSAQTTVISQLNAPSALATDASGSLFVVDQGNSQVSRYPNINGSFGTKTLVSNGISSPYGVAIDSFGNLYITDNVNALVEQVARVQATLNFGVDNVNTTSPTFTAAVANSGNQSITFASPSYTINSPTTAGFSVTSDGCSGETVTPGSSCAIAATFSPLTPELDAEETLTLSGAAGNGMPSISLIGTGANLTPSTVSLVLTSPAAGTPLAVGIPVSFTATIGTGTNTAIPGGNVKFYVNGSQVETVNVVNDEAVLSLPNGLPDGAAVAITATYSGDGINYVGSTATLTEVVSALPTTLTLTVLTPYTNPNSANDVVTNATGPSIPLIATLAVSGNIIPGGTVSFYSGSTLLGMSSVVAAGNGTYQTQPLSTTALRANTSNVAENNSYITTYPSIYAVYSGDTSYSGSTSNTEAITIIAPPNPLPNCANPPVMSITNTSMTAGIATYSYTLTSGSSPVIGELVSVTNTTNGSGVFNISNNIITSVSATSASAGTFTVAGFNTSLNYTSAAESGAATVTQTCSSTGSTFTLSPTNPSITVAASTTGTSSGSTTLTVSSYGGWQGVLNFTCTGLPTYATCAPYPGAAVVTASTSDAPLAPTQIQFIINTNLTPIVPTASMSWWVSGLLGLMLFITRRRIRRFGYNQLFTILGVALLLTSSIFGMVGCSTGGPGFVTPAGTTNVTVTVHASQLVPNTTNGSTYLPDVNAGTFQIALTVK